jgi:drug/metabolite transporter (DMT)-like permease
MGPISALSVTFLIPVFGILWGVLFLDEQIGWSTIIGALVVLAGTALTNGVTPRFFLESGKSSRPDRPEKSP